MHILCSLYRKIWLYVACTVSGEPSEA